MKIDVQATKWTVTLANDTTICLEGDITNRIKQLTEIISKHEVTQGSINKEEIVKIDGKIVELAQYLTEKTNRPFVVGAIDNATNIPWEVVLSRLYTRKR